MEVINNFITDLLDEMLAAGATNLVILPGSKPSIMVSGVFRAVPGYGQIDTEELMADLEALGLIGLDDTGSRLLTYFREPPLAPEKFEVKYGRPSGRLLLDISLSQDFFTGITSTDGMEG